MTDRGIQAALLPDGRRLHLRHGPIDLVIEAWGEADEVRAAYRQAIAAFADVLPRLVEELPLLRAPLGAEQPSAAGPVARRMVDSCWPYRSVFITPMAAVAGAVADHMLDRMIDGRRLARAYVNDGGDIAFHLAPGARLTCGLVADLAAPAINGTLALDAAMPVRGLATSGRACKGSGGRSFSFGIADAVTVLARDAAAADAAATIVANAVDLPGHAAIGRAPAADIDPDSDLGDRLVTVDVGPLAAGEVRAALATGVSRAAALQRAGLIYGAVLVLRRHFVTVGAEIARLAAA
ncbi:MAG: UPF0280 family protein [Proteobacteria bacterium]|nr:UPF0280 family protein [Pseudomonadota bacterium]